MPLHIHVRSLTVLLKGGGGAAEQERGKEIREKHGLTRLTIRMVTGSVVRIDDSLLNDYGGGRM